MSRWTKKQLETIDNITFVIAVLNERRRSTTNPYSPLNQKINSAIRDLEKIKAERLRQMILREGR